MADCDSIEIGKNCDCQLNRIPKIIWRGTILPVRGTTHSAGYDLSTPRDVVLPAGKTTCVPLDVWLDFGDAKNFFGKLESRSSLAKQGIVTVGGVIDPDYTGMLKVLLLNTQPTDFQLAAGMRVCQIIFQPFTTVCFESGEGASMDAPTVREERGSLGFGSTNSS